MTGVCKVCRGVEEELEDSKGDVVVENVDMVLGKKKL